MGRVVRRARAAAAFAAVVLLAGCSSGQPRAAESRSPTRSEVAQPPAAGPAGAEADRRFFLGPGLSVLTVHQLSGRLGSKPSKVTCRSTREAVAAAIKASAAAPTPSVNGSPDQVTAELAADEMSALAAALVRCASGGAAAPTVLNRLAAIYAAFDNRLHAEGVLK
jgi:hypothetical protein